MFTIEQALETLAKAQAIGLDQNAVLAHTHEEIATMVNDIAESLYTFYKANMTMQESNLIAFESIWFDAMQATYHTR